MKKLKVYKLQINPSTDDSSGVDCISIVNDPAIMKNFVAFSSDSTTKFKFAITDEDQQIITGPIMIPDFPIYRKDVDDQGNVTDEYYVLADKPTITSVIQKFFKTQRSSNTSLEHSGNLLNGVYIIESFQVDSKRGINAPTGYGTIPDGTWFGSMKVESKQIWAAIKDGTFNGFSIEGLFTFEDTPQTVVQQSKVSALSYLLS
jgi:hypothetical protein